MRNVHEARPVLWNIASKFVIAGNWGIARHPKHRLHGTAGTTANPPGGSEKRRRHRRHQNRAKTVFQNCFPTIPETRNSVAAIWIPPPRELSKTAGRLPQNLVPRPSMHPIRRSSRPQLPTHRVHPSFWKARPGKRSIPLDPEPARRPCGSPAPRVPRDAMSRHTEPRPRICRGTHEHRNACHQRNPPYLTNGPPAHCVRDERPAIRGGRYWARTSDLSDVNAALSQLS